MVADPQHIGMYRVAVKVSGTMRSLAGRRRRRGQIWSPRMRNNADDSMISIPSPIIVIGSQRARGQIPPCGNFT